jgi:hypothetical protein
VAWSCEAVCRHLAAPVQLPAAVANVLKCCWPYVSLLPAGAHYYCDTLDISRPFPSERPPHQPSWPFVWNKALSMPFRSAGLDGPQTVCPALLQVRCTYAGAPAGSSCMLAARIRCKRC